MRIVIAGGSGFLGSALVRAWRGDGHEIKVLTRHAASDDDVPWVPQASGNGWRSTIEGAGAVVNLAGEGIADQRWTEERKAAILSSRVAATRALALAIRESAQPPRIFISASAIGYYGPHADEPLTETSLPGSDFLARVCQSWERETEAAAGIARVVLLRTGLVLARDGGALPKMAMPFRFFVGGRVGTGRQYMSWIHLTDWVEMVRWALRTDVSGPLNLTAPVPVTNSEFTRALGAAMRRPTLFPVPALALQVMLGQEFANALLLGGQRVLPARAQRLGFQFRFATIESALRDIF